MRTQKTIIISYAAQDHTDTKCYFIIYQQQQNKNWITSQRHDEQIILQIVLPQST